MPTIFTHAIAGAAIAQVLAPCSRRRELTWIAAACAMLPDVDAIGFRFGIHYGDLLGHRGFTHSFLFAGMVALAAIASLWNKARPIELVQAFACIFLATTSHGMLDACTNGGLGVAFLAPFDETRYFFPARPIQVSPLSVEAFLTQRGASVLASEVAWVWCPSIIAGIAGRLVRCRRTKQSRARASPAAL